MRIALLSLHGLIRGENLELGRDEDTGGQTKYVVELARALAEQDDVARVDLITRQIFDDRVSDDYAQPEEKIGDGAYIVRIPFGPRRYLYKTKLWPYMEQFVDQCLPELRLPVLIRRKFGALSQRTDQRRFAPLPQSQPVGAIDLILIKQVGEPFGQLEAFAQVIVIGEETPQRLEAVAIKQPG